MSETVNGGTWVNNGQNSQWSFGRLGDGLHNTTTLVSCRINEGELPFSIPYTFLTDHPFFWMTTNLRVVTLRTLLVIKQDASWLLTSPRWTKFLVWVFIGLMGTLSSSLFRNTNKWRGFWCFRTFPPGVRDGRTDTCGVNVRSLNIGRTNSSLVLTRHSVIFFHVEYTVSPTIESFNRKSTRLWTKPTPRRFGWTKRIKKNESMKGADHRIYETTTPNPIYGSKSTREWTEVPSHSFMDLLRYVSMFAVVSRKELVF